MSLSVDLIINELFISDDSLTQFSVLEKYLLVTRIFECTYMKRLTSSIPPTSQKPLLSIHKDPMCNI